MNLVETLFSPLSLDEASAVFDKFEPQLIKGDPAKIEKCLPGFSRDSIFEDLLEKASAREDGLIGVYLNPDPTSTGQYNGLRVNAEDGKKAMSFASSAITIYNCQQFDRRIQRLLSSFSSNFTIMGMMMASMWRSVGKFVIPPHSDTMSVIQLQLTGKKRWHVLTSDDPSRYVHIRGLDAQGNYPVELEDGTIEMRKVDPSAFQEFTAEPGDVLLFPCGAWHSTEQLSDETSLALSIFYRPVPLSEIFKPWMDETFESSREWSDPPLLSRRHRNDTTEIETYLKARFDELIAELRKPGCTRSILNEWGRIAAANTIDDKIVETADSAPEVSENTVLNRHPLTTVTTGRGLDGRMHLYYGEKFLVLEKQDSENLAEMIAANDVFRAGDALGWAQADVPNMNWQTVQHILGVMLEEGFLVIQPQANDTFQT